MAPLLQDVSDRSLELYCVLEASLSRPGSTPENAAFRMLAAHPAYVGSSDVERLEFAFEHNDLPWQHARDKNAATAPTDMSAE